MRTRRNSVWVVVLALAAAMVGLTPQAGWCDDTVSPQTGGVDREGNLTGGGHVGDPSQPHDSLTVTMGQTRFDQTIVHPSPWLFGKFGDHPQWPTPEYCQLWGAYLALQAPVEGELSIRMTFLLSTDYSADSFPVIGYGNLKRPSGGSGTAVGPGSAGGIGEHWSASLEVSEPTLQLRLNSGSEDDQYIPYSSDIESVDSTATVTLFSGELYVTY